MAQIQWGLPTVTAQALITSHFCGSKITILVQLLLIAVQLKLVKPKLVLFNSYQAVKIIAPSESVKNHLCASVYVSPQTPELIEHF